MTKRASTTRHARSAAPGTTPRGLASVAFVVQGVCYSMKNSKIPRRYGRGMVKHPKAVAFERDFLAQVPPSAKLGLGSKTRPLRVNIGVYYPSWRQDVDVALVYDCLQAAGVVSNDRWIREQHVYGAQIDNKNPRVEITVEEI